MSTTRTRLGALVTAGVLTFGLAACGGEDDPETTPASTVEDTAVEDETAADEQTEDETATDEQTGTEETATEEETGDAGDATEGEQIPIEEFLALLQEPGEDMLSNYTISMDMEGQQQGVEGAVDLSGDSLRMRISLATPDMGNVELIFADGEAYMAVPGLTPEGMYLLAPADMLGDTAELEEIDVSTQWETWEQGAQEVIFLGEEDVDGEQMRRYQVTVDTAAVAEAAGEDAAATSLGLEETLVYDVWIDDESLMRMMTFGNMGMEGMSMRMDNWGEEQDIQVPDPEQVMDMDELGSGTG